MRHPERRPRRAAWRRSALLLAVGALLAATVGALAIARTTRPEHGDAGGAGPDGDRVGGVRPAAAPGAPAGDGPPVIIVRMLALPERFVVSDDDARADLAEAIGDDAASLQQLRQVFAGMDADDVETAEVWLDHALERGGRDADAVLWLFALAEDLDLVPQDPDWEKPERLVRQLAIVGTHRQASARMWACRYLADAPALPATAPALLLRCAESDPDLRVRAWAGAALHCHGDRSRDWSRAVAGLAIPASIAETDRGDVEMAIEVAVRKIRQHGQAPPPAP